MANLGYGFLVRIASIGVGLVLLQVWVKLGLKLKGVAIQAKYWELEMVIGATLRSSKFKWKIKVLSRNKGISNTCGEGA